MSLGSWARGRLPASLTSAVRRRSPGSTGLVGGEAAVRLMGPRTLRESRDPTSQGGGGRWTCLAMGPCRQTTPTSGHSVPHHRNQSRPGPREKPKAERSLLKRVWLGLSRRTGAETPLTASCGPHGRGTAAAGRSSAACLRRSLRGFPLRARTPGLDIGRSGEADTQVLLVLPPQSMVCR